MSQGPLAPPPYQAQAPGGSAPEYSTYDNQGNNYAPQQPKPAYTGGQNYEMNNGANSSYYNNDQSNSYGHNNYAPPAGPPPGQNSGIVR